MKKTKLLSTFRYLTLIVLVGLGLGAILFVLKGNVLAVGILAAVAVLISLVWHWISTCCPKCKRGWYMKVISREPLYDEDVSVTDNLSAWSATDKSYHSSSVATNATRKVYKETLKCRKCGHTETLVRTVNLKH